GTAESTSPSEIGSDLFFIAKSNIMLRPYLSQEWMTNLSHSLRSGMMLQRWTVHYLRDWLTSFTEDSPVRTLALQERVRGWMESEVDFLEKSSESAKKHPLRSFSLKTYRQLEPEDQLKCKK